MRKFTIFIISSLLASSLLADIKKIEVRDLTIPVIIRRDYNPVMALNLKSDEEDTLLGVSLNILGKHVKDYESISVYRAKKGKDGKIALDRDKNPVDDQVPDELLGSISKKKIKKGKCYIKCQGDLASGDNHIWISVTPSNKASLKRFIKFEVKYIKTKESKKTSLKKASCKQRIGYALTVPHFSVQVLKPGSTKSVQERRSKFARIPGLTCTKKGTLIAVFDNRYHHNGDLPADIDCGISRSTDGGQTWSPVITCLAARDIAGIGRGVGDPTILLDQKNNRIWVAALAAPKTGHPIWKSETGTTSPDRCGQFILSYSDDEGKTWSQPINITEKIKRLQDPDTAKWALVFNGPGNGLCMRNGTLVFPAQVWGHKGDKKVRWSCLVYSKDNGKTWQSSKAMDFGGSENQVAELSDGSLMINTREGIRGLRQVGVTKDMGETWKKHNSVSTAKGRLVNTFCQACLISIFNKKSKKNKNKQPYHFGKKNYKHLLFFSNPTKNRRRYMTLKYSKDDGDSWNKGLLYDQRNGMGYSAIYPIDKNYLGVFYESQGHYLQFIKVKYKDILQAN